MVITSTGKTGKKGVFKKDAGSVSANQIRDWHYQQIQV